MTDMLTLPETDSLQAVQDYVRRMHKSRGFTADASSELLMLTEEVGELAKAVRKEAGLKFSATTRRTEAAEEVADVFIVLLALASILDIDVYEAFRAKETKTRKGHGYSLVDANDTQNAGLAAFQRYVQQVMQERGFDDETVSQKFMLLLEETGEFAQSARKNANLAQATDTAAESLGDAAADVFAVLLDICNQLGLDLEKAFIKREHQNQQRNWE